MATQESPIAVTHQNHKLAALFYDHLMVFGAMSAVGPPDEVLPSELEWPGVERLMFGQDFYDLMNRIMPDFPEVGGSREQQINQQLYSDVVAIYYAQAYSTPSRPVVPVLWARRALVGFCRPGGLDALQIVVDDVPTIDTSRAEWHQILEVRRDMESLSAVRKLRLFFTSDYSGKSKSCVLNDIECKLVAFERARKKHGFNLLTSSIGFVLDGRSQMSAAAMTFVAATTPFGSAESFFDTPIALGKLTFGISKRKCVLREGRSSNELAFLIETAQDADSR